MAGEISVEEARKLPIECNVYQANSHKWTFQDDTVRRWVEERLSGSVLNACAGETQLNYTGPIHRNDVNEDRDADTHYDVKEIDQHLDASFDTIVYDPPWSFYQVNDKYEGRGQDVIKQSTKAANAIDELLAAGGTILAFGYTLNMFPNGLNYEMNRAAVFTIPGPGKDFFGSVHQKTQKGLSDF